jgi:PDZ domain/Aspartyl protease
MVLDTGSTGAASTVLKPEIAEKLGLELQGTVQTEGPGKGEDETLHLAKNVTVSFAGEMLTGQTIATLPLDYIEREAGQPADGLLGGSIFTHFVVHENYAAKTISLTSPQKFVAPIGYTSVPLLVAGTASLVRLQIQALSGETVEGTFLLDSGLVSPVMFMKTFVDAHPALKSGKLLAIPGVTAVGGEMQISMGRLAGLSLGPFMLRRPTALFLSTNPGPASAMLAGIVGNGILRRFDVIFDYPHSKLWLKPNPDEDKPFPAIPSGILLTVAPPQFHRVEVRAVIAGSAAADAGVLAGDIVTAVSHQQLSVLSKAGKASSPLTLEQVADYLQDPRQNVYLRLKRDGKPIAVHLRTRNLI